MKYLEDITICDFSNRLPGPLCTAMLLKMGAHVMKIEEEAGDPFNTELGEKDESFKIWYEEINAGKQILKFNFETDQEKIKKIIQHSDIVLMPKHDGFQKKLGFNIQEYKTFKMGIIEYGASKEDKSPMHDLNALAVSGLLSFYLKDRKEEIVDPPFLPLAGATFAQGLATEILAVLFKSKQSKTFVSHEYYLMDAIENVYGFFLNSVKKHNGKFLHNGLYPCYSIYRLKDGHFMVVAAIEEKFWNKFTEIFHLGSLNRFGKENFEIISRKISGMRTKDARELLKGQDICVNIV